MKRYKRCIDSRLILSACIISIIVSVSTVGETWGMGRIIDILEIKDWNVFIYLLLFVAGMVVVQYIGNTLNIFIKGRALQKIRFNLQTLLGEKTLDMDYMTAKEYKSGELNFMFLSDVEKISGFWQTFMDGIGGAVTAVVSIFLCGYISWKFLAAALAAFPVVLGLTGIVNRKVHGAVNEARAGSAASASIFLNDIQNQMLIQSYQLQKYAEEKYAKAQAEERAAVAKEMSVRGQVGASNRITGAIPYLTIFVTGAVLIWHNEISLGDFFAFAYIFSNIQSVTNIPEIISAHKIYQVSSEKIMDFINKAEPVVKGEERTEEIPCGERSGQHVENGLYLENLTFSVTIHS